MSNHGLTLIEILVAMTVLVIGATGLVGLQLATMKLARLASMNARLLHVADSELQYRLLGLGAGTACTALTGQPPEDVDCTVSTEGCTVLTAGFSCSQATPGWPRRFTVQAGIEGGPQITLSGVGRRVSAP